MFDRKKYMERYYIKNKEKLSKINKQWRKDNLEKARKIGRQWQKDNPEKVKKIREKYYENNREKVIKRTKQWIKDNREKVRKNFCQWRTEKRKTDLKYNLNGKVRRAISISLEGGKKGRNWEKLVGFTLDALINRLLQTMPEGYTWQDYLNGKLHIDHIIPIRAFQFKSPEDEEFKQCWSLYNLRLLPIRENLLKKDTIGNPILIGLLIRS